MTVRAALVGVGWWGREHLKALADSDKMKIVRLVDPGGDAARKTAGEYDLPLSPDYADVLADEAIDAVILATPHDLHTEQIVAAAAAGKHVFAEKPFAMSAADAKRQVAACEDAGVVLGVGLIQRFNTAHRRIKQWLDDGRLGVAMHGEANTSHDVLLRADGWRRDPAQAPTGGIHHTGQHMIDLFAWMLGPVTRVYGQLSSHVFENDTATALLTFASGATATVTNVMATAEQRYFHLFGSAGWARREGATLLSFRPRGGAIETVDLPPSHEVRANDEAFADAVTGGAPYPISTDEMIHLVTVLDALARSMQTGTAVDVTD